MYSDEAKELLWLLKKGRTCQPVLVQRKVNVYQTIVRIHGDCQANDQDFPFDCLAELASHAPLFDGVNPGPLEIEKKVQFPGPELEKKNV